MMKSEWIFWVEDQWLLHPDGRYVHLTKHEVKVLEAILCAHGHAARRVYVNDFVWGLETDGDKPVKTLDVVVYRLKKKLSVTDFTIETIHRVGFHATKKVEIFHTSEEIDCCETCKRPFLKPERTPDNLHDVTVKIQ